MGKMFSLTLLQSFIAMYTIFILKTSYTKLIFIGSSKKFTISSKITTKSCILEEDKEKIKIKSILL
jgi:hypothetical protein